MAFDEYLRRWRLENDGAAIETPYSRLLPVRFEGVPAILKIATAREERAGAGLMVWWQGEGAARVFEHEGEALLMERATGVRSLAEMAARGSDDEATLVVCAAAARLHERRGQGLPDLVPLENWFEAIWPAVGEYGGLFIPAAATARRLIADQREPVVLHGDLHHGNVLDFGERGWLAIDPKGLYGERTFDFVNLLRNPNPSIALLPGRFERQVDLICRSAGLERRRLLEWTLAFACLSAAWILADGGDPSLDLSVATIASAELGIE